MAILAHGVASPPIYGGVDNLYECAWLKRVFYE